MPPRKLLPPGWAFGAALRHARQRKKLTQAQLGARLNISRAHISQLETGHSGKSPGRQMVAKLAAELDLDGGRFFNLATDRSLPIPELRPNDPNPADPESHFLPSSPMLKLPVSGADSLPPPPAAAAPGEMPRDVPILKVKNIPGVVGMRLGDQIVDYAPRPRGIIQATEVMGFRWPFTDMEPAIRPGQVLYADRGRPVFPGDDVLLGITDPEHLESPIFFVRRLVSSDADGYVVEYFSPDRTRVTYAANNVRQIVHILTVNELLGIV